MSHDPDPFDSRQLVTSASNLIKFIREGELIPGLSQMAPDPDQRTQYKHKPSKTYKRKGGKPPVEYTATELMIDLERAIDDEEPDLDVVATYYFPLARLVGLFS